MFTTPIIVLGEKGFSRFDPPRETFIGQQNELVKAIAANQINVIHNVFSLKIGDASYPCSVATKQDWTYAFVQLPKLVLNSAWALSEDGKYAFLIGVKRRDVATDFTSTFTWVPPDTMKLWFIMRWVKERWDSPFLVASKLGKGEFYKLPMPNVFSDGRMCMGDNYRPETAGSIQQRAQADIDALNKSNWNNHLINESAAEFRITMFKFSPEGVQRAIPKDWPSYAYKINSVHFDIGIPV